LIPASSADLIVSSANASSFAHGRLCPPAPQLMQPTVIRETSSPVSPNVVYSMRSSCSDVGVPSTLARRR
jgi:hypothetical protein